MLAKILPIILNWAWTILILPAIYYSRDYLVLKKEESDSNKAIKDLENAKTLKEKVDASNNIP